MANADYSAQNASGWVQIAVALGQGWLQRENTKTQNNLRAANAAARDIARAGNNELQAAESTFARWAQSVTNQRRLRVSGQQFDAAQEALTRLQDSRAAGSVARRVQASEEQGILAAKAAFAGVTGTASDVLAGTTALRAALTEEQATRTGEQQEYEVRSRTRRVISESIEGLDNTAVLSNLDRNRAIPQADPTQGNFLADIAGSGADFAAMYRYFATSGPKPDDAPYSNEGHNYPAPIVRDDIPQL